MAADLRSCILSRLDAELAKCEAATPGPWETSEHRFPSPPFEGELEREWGIYPPLGESGPVALVCGADSASFITSARTYLPLVLRALRGEVEAHRLYSMVLGDDCESMCEACGVPADDDCPCPSLRRIASALGIGE